MTLVQKAATTFGVVFILVGILGFIPAFTPDGHLLGIFAVNGVHNAIHLLSGIAALALSRTHKNARLYFQVFGVVYGLVTLLGLFYGDSAILVVLRITSQIYSCTLSLLQLRYTLDLQQSAKRLTRRYSSSVIRIKKKGSDTLFLFTVMLLAGHMTSVNLRKKRSSRSWLECGMINATVMGNWRNRHGWGTISYATTGR